MTREFIHIKSIRELAKKKKAEEKKQRKLEKKEDGDCA